MKKEHLSGFALLAFIAGSFIFTLPHLKQAVATLETPSLTEALEGKWCTGFEKALRQCLPVDGLSRDLWGRAEYALFHEGRKGVVVGKEGWLFTDEELSCPVNARKNLQENLSYIDEIRKSAAERKSALAIVLIPEKARIMEDRLNITRLPPCREQLYEDALEYFLEKGIPAANLLPAMMLSGRRDALYLQTDTHWSPAGAKLAAYATAETVRDAFPALDLPRKHFSLHAGAIKEYKGDLTNYIPGVDFAPEHIVSFATGVSVASAGNAENLLGDDDVPAAVLVGTSYSANPNWNFENFLKDALKTDIANMSDQGLGPLVVMDKYLSSDAWRETPPKLLIWEIPERYLLYPHGVTG